MTGNVFKRYVTLGNLLFAFALIQFGWLVWYFYTGFGGPQELVSRLLSIALIVQILFMYQQDYLYKWLPPRVNQVIVAVYIGICLYAFFYFLREFEQVAIWRQGSYTREDFIVGLLMFLLVMELSRLAHPTLFWVNVVMVVYTLWGYLSPLDFFWHPGVSFYRIVTSSTVEFSTGIYGIYGQLALTLIAAFLLLAGVANGFEAQRAMINVMRIIAGRSRQMVPQTAVLGSSAVGMISGSGSANAAVVGTITIPLMMRYGVPPAFAAAVETAASMGGLMMPPMMGVGAFLMSDYLGVPYWEVVKRGFSLAIVYYVSIAHRDLSPVRAPATARSGRAATGSALRQDQDRYLLLLGAVPALSDGLGRHGRTARGALHRELHVHVAARGVPLLQIRSARPHAGEGDAIRQYPARH